MKYLMYALVGVLLLVMITACSHEPAFNQSTASALNPEQEISNPSNEVGDIVYGRTGKDMHNNWQGMHMVVAADSVTPAGLRLSMINDSELNFGYGYEYRIEQYTNGEWEQVPFIIDSVAWRMPLFGVAPNTIVDENISWEHMHGQLQPGFYRLVRKFIEHDWHDPTPMWEQEIPEAHLYAVFTIEQDWQTANDRWQDEQDELATIAFARYEGLVLEILESSPRGLIFTLINNNPNYSYLINSVFVGWEDNVQGLGSAGAVEYSIFPGWFSDGDSWPFGEDKRLQPGEHLYLEVDWYSQIGNLSPSMGRLSPNPYVFEIVVDVTLDVDGEYIQENFRHTIPGLPNYAHRIRADFDVSP